MTQATAQPPPIELQALVSSLRGQMEYLIRQEFERVQEGMWQAFADMKARLADTEAQLEALRDENMRLALENAEHAEALKQYRDLARALEEDA